MFAERGGDGFRYIYRLRGERWVVIETGSDTFRLLHRERRVVILLGYCRRERRVVVERYGNGMPRLWSMNNILSGL